MQVLSNILLPRLSPHADAIIGEHQHGFHMTGHIYPESVKYFGKKYNTMRQCISYFHFKKA
jgi:hypothetical protein